MDLSYESVDRKDVRMVKEPFVGHSGDGYSPPELWNDFRACWRDRNRSPECDRVLKHWFRQRFYADGFYVSERGHVTSSLYSFSFSVKDEELCILPAYSYIRLMRTMGDFVRTAGYISVNSKFTYF